tara:strand:+ start:128 stop:1954 length:1827 start_codon:yes stop_codon:yes gene_type:complete
LQRLTLAALIAALMLSPTATARDVTVVLLETSFGDIEIEMLDLDAPLTVQNFLNYVSGGDYDNTIIHRSVPGFVLQGGGWFFVPTQGQVDRVPADPPVLNEPGVSNLRGTVAMAKLGGDPNSATSEWFFNLGNNSGNLDNQNGGFTVFGRVLTGMNVVDTIAGQPIWNFGGAFTDMPTIGYVQGQAVRDDHFVKVIRATRLTLADTDNDGTLDREDTDDDNDGIPDIDDPFPLDPAESVDTDGDGVGDNADTDDDNDGVTDDTDAFPLNGAETADLDVDGIGDNADPDDDGDGINDVIDAFPQNVAESADTDGDGIGNNADTDDDGDGAPDLLDVSPYDANVSVSTGTRLANISTRGSVRQGDEVLIGGLVIAGTEPKTVILRARGPSLVDADPNLAGRTVDGLNLTVFDGAGNVLTAGQDWQDHAAAMLLPDSLRPGRAGEAAVTLTLAPGAYTAIVTGGVTGLAIVEVFELGDTGPQRLLNISTRGYVGTGDDVLIGGVIISGADPATVVVRARGPSMAEVSPGLAGQLLNDPRIRLFNLSGVMIAENDSWAEQGDGAPIPVSQQPGDAAEAALMLTLQPGAYTAIVDGANGGSGIGIVEVIEVSE